MNSTNTGKSIFEKLIATDSDRTQMLLRVALGIMILPHGAQKLLGWFGGYGFSGTMGFFTGALGLPYIIGLLVIIAEFFGGLALIFGFLGRISAFGVGVTLAVAALITHVGNGFFMNWGGMQKGEGFEFHLLAVVMAAVVMIKGSGALSIDRLLAGRRVEVGARVSRPGFAPQN